MRHLNIQELSLEDMTLQQALAAWLKSKGGPSIEPGCFQIKGELIDRTRQSPNIKGAAEIIIEARAAFIDYQAPLTVYHEGKISY